MIRLTSALLIGLLAVVPVAASGDNEKPASKNANDERDEEVLSFSNEDLERKYGSREDKDAAERPPTAEATGKKPGEGEQSALEKMFAEEAARKDGAAKIAAAEAAVAAAKERVALLEKTKLAIVNPYLARPKPPEDPEEAERWKAEGAKGRLSSTDSELDAARKALAEAEKDLAKARAN